MAKTHVLTPYEREGIVKLYPQVGLAETARRIGCSQSSVQRVWAQDGQSAQSEAADRPNDSEPKTQLERLIETRDALRTAMLDAPPQAVAGISREYRATLDEIEQLEGGDDDEASKALAAIAESIAKRMPS